MCALPAAILAACEPTEECRPPLGGLRRDTILLVEDHDVVAGLITKVLLQHGWKVVRVLDGATCEAEFAVRREQIALVVLDFRLPDTDGVTLCQRLRESSAQMPVVLTSGRDQSAIMEMLERGGPTAFLPKPFYPQDVARQVAALLGTVA